MTISNKIVFEDSSASHTMMGLRVTSVKVFRQKSGDDLISFEFMGPSAFPLSSGNTSKCTFNVQHGHAEEWLKETFRLYPENYTITELPWFKVSVGFIKE